MSDRKQMMDIQKHQSVEKALSNENQRRWSDDLFKRKADDPKTNYDPTRTRLNFEIVKGGKVQAVDKSISIGDKIENTIKERVTGRVNAKSVRCVSIIYGGNRERMRELAFGNQIINEEGNNDQISRHSDIERWAQDIYQFTCQEFGEENITSFIVHLDELNPHVHCMVVPITPDGRLSAKDMFGGKDINAARQRMKQLHDHLAEINRKWGLDRGDSIEETGAKHRSLENYRRDLLHENMALEMELSEKRKTLNDLNAEIQKAERAVKGLTTMVGNLEQQQKNVEAEILRLEFQLRNGQGNVEELKKAIDEKKTTCELFDMQIRDKKQTLQNVEQRLGTLRTDYNILNMASRQLEKSANISIGEGRVQIIKELSVGMLNEIVNEFARRFPQLSYDDRSLFEDTLLKDMLERGSQIINTGIYLFAQSVAAATDYAESHGGGGVSCDSNWGRKDDEDDILWSIRCARMARHMMKPMKSRGLHR